MAEHRNAYVQTQTGFSSISRMNMPCSEQTYGEIRVWSMHQGDACGGAAVSQEAHVPITFALNNIRDHVAI